MKAPDLALVSENKRVKGLLFSLKNSKVLKFILLPNCNELADDQIFYPWIRFFFYAEVIF